MTYRHITLVALLALVPGTAFAHGAGGHPADPNLHVDSALEDCSVQFSSELTQGAFGRFAREFGAVSAFKLASPPTTLGQWGFAIDLEQIWFHVEEHSAAWNDTFAHPDSYHELGSDLAFPKLRARVGITPDFDVGVFFTKQPTANYGWLGLEAKYGLLKQSEEMPISLALRGAYTKTLFVSDMDMHALTADVSAGRTFWHVLTPYLGLGSDLVLARETADVVELDDELQLAPHLIAGLEARYWHVALGAEAQLATLPTFQIQASAVF
jgi:hypothetical protein